MLDRLVHIVQFVAHRYTSLGTRLRPCFLPVRNAERYEHEEIDEESCVPSDSVTCINNHGRGRDVTGTVDRHQGRQRTSLRREVEYEGGCCFAPHVTVETVQYCKGAPYKSSADKLSQLDVCGSCSPTA
jgi:hypothetical protein